MSVCIYDPVLKNVWLRIYIYIYIYIGEYIGENRTMCEQTTFLRTSKNRFVKIDVNVHGTGG